MSCTSDLENIIPNPSKDTRDVMIKHFVNQLIKTVGDPKTKPTLNEIEKLLPKTISTSYYIGGMKEEVRESGAIEAKVLLASYSMASEAMNIKSLNSVILASPRTNVEQSTGRILRTRVSERVIQPMIIDIIDPHDPLMNQWRSRKNYYKKCEYSIETVQQGKNDGIKEKESAKKEIKGDDKWLVLNSLNQIVEAINNNL